MGGPRVIARSRVAQSFAFATPQHFTTGLRLPITYAYRLGRLFATRSSTFAVSPHAPPLAKAARVSTLSDTPTRSHAVPENRTVTTPAPATIAADNKSSICSVP